MWALVLIYPEGQAGVDVKFESDAERWQEWRNGDVSPNRVPVVWLLCWEGVVFVIAFTCPGGRTSDD